ncbi:MAG TPA: DUF3054 domain-containing protein [Gordonia sp. (in: high G+C Gram-positive bacteria)]|uniref:DUF3054 domain-containing protein n=1 Tax=unclassified Gordonia (in: high G+C Gram-positive bacteria) TaxID=2657482 RepID=UPI000FA9B508|nr:MULTISPECIES: DUF3054 domain-containing protein [unclassified Gordonia (in: high G+C Gram-positive bacteria)]RUP38986.1 MAG: DUF3054 domain-containing protein [Gordonia sp. (in: high G+C Gram-positive bacteria)]HNP56398.1 DUF3054 domain-containing protein [Gordonia sp. (in: high G+C Gram-positive bacteria)]HRC51260.1 DUF3054 domain-containing protein [Gordonia sp. (in: high G+C Gram-positive bacteria)]
MTTGVNTRQPGPTLQLPLLVTAVVDVVMIALFAASGRESHRKDMTVLGVVDTAWPFLAGAAVGWSLMYVYAHIGSPDSAGARVFRPERPVPFGVAIWIFTVAVGMTLRAVLHQGTAAAFICVATVVLCLFLVGWRIVANRAYRLVTRRQRQ